MAGSTINTTITHGVTLGSPGYPSPLTITSAGGIAPSATGATALYATLSAGYVLNQGGIAGATGGVGTMARSRRRSAAPAAPAATVSISRPAA